MIDALKNLENEASQELSALSDIKTLQDLKIKYLGRKGLFAAIFFAGRDGFSCRINAGAQPGAAG